MVASSAMCVPLQLGLQAIEQVGVDTGIDFLAENLLGTLVGQRCHLLTQGFAGLHRLLLGFGPGGGNNLVSFFSGLGLGFFDDGLCTAVVFSQSGSRLVARL